MPEGALTGFTKASRIGRETVLSTDSGEDDQVAEEEELLPKVQGEEGLLTEHETARLQKLYMRDFGAVGTDLVMEMPRTDAHPEYQRKLAPANHVRHGAATKRFVKLVNTMLDVDDAQLERWKKVLDLDLLKEPETTTLFKTVRPRITAFKPVRPAGAVATVTAPAARRRTLSVKEMEREAEEEDDEDELVPVKSSKIIYSKTGRAPRAPKAAKPPARVKAKKAVPLSSDSSGEDEPPPKKKLTTGKRRGVVTDDSEDAGAKKPATRKRRKVVSDDEDEDVSMVEELDSEDLPDAHTLLSSFRFAGSGKKVGRRT